MELSSAAAACYLAAGWRRSAQQMLAQVAELLMGNGQLAAAVAVMQRQALLFLGAGWLHIAARLLHDLLMCQQQLYQVTRRQIQVVDSFTTVGL